MKARKRFFLLFFIAFLALIHFAINKLNKSFVKNITINESMIETKQNFYEMKNIFRLKNERKKSSINSSKKCSMNTCFDFKLCQNLNELKIHLYNPLINSNSNKLSESFQKILTIIQNSKYYEKDPKKGIYY
jgi:hypothetical protein